MHEMYIINRKTKAIKKIRFNWRPTNRIEDVKKITKCMNRDRTSTSARHPAPSSGASTSRRVEKVAMHVLTTAARGITL